MACVGRLAVEKNLDAFLGLNLPGTKVMIGDGPQRHALAARHPGAVFTGYRYGEGARPLPGHGGCAGVPEPHRHLRAGNDRGARLRRAGGGPFRCPDRSM